MKTIHTLLLAGAVVTGLAMASQARADVFLSPRAQANQIRTVSGGEAGPNLVNANYLGAGQKAADLLPAVTSGSTASPSLVSGNYLGAAAKNPARDLHSGQFEIAPVVEKTHPAQCGGCCQGK